MKYILNILFIFLIASSSFLYADYDWRENLYDQTDQTGKPDWQKKKWIDICSGYVPFPEKVTSMQHKNIIFHFTETQDSELDGKWINPSCYDSALTIRDSSNGDKVIHKSMLDGSGRFMGIEFIEINNKDYAFIGSHSGGANCCRSIDIFSFFSQKFIKKFISFEYSPVYFFKRHKFLVSCVVDFEKMSQEYEKTGVSIPRSNYGLYLKPKILSFQSDNLIEVDNQNLLDLLRKITEDTFYEELDVNKTAKEICKWKNEMLIDFDYDYKTYYKYRLKRQGNISN